jgi:DNA-binding phage protein
MTDEDRQAFQIASEQVVAARRGTGTLNQHSAITASTIWRALLAEGYNVSRDAIEKHIAQSCVCRSS